MQKQCTKCKQWKDHTLFNKQKNTKDGFTYYCKGCIKQNKKYYYKNNKNKIKIKNGLYHENNKSSIKQNSKLYRYYNKEHCSNYNGQYYKNNKYKLKKHRKEYYKNRIKNDHTKYSNYLDYCRIYNNSTVYINSTITNKIKKYEEVKTSPSGNIMCKCAYCGGWFEPTRNQLNLRLKVINGSKNGEGRLYCSQNCKQNCSIYNQKKWPKEQKPTTAREVQPELKHMVFKRDNYTCQKCNTHRDNLEVGIHCHHKEGILWEPLQSADIDMCITLCEYCHKEVHKIPGCGYHEMRCT